MRIWLSRILVIPLLVSILPFPAQSANANADSSQWEFVTDYPDTAPLGPAESADILNVGMATYYENEDELVIKIIMKKSFEEVAFSEEGLSLAIVIQNACASWDKCKPAGAVSYLMTTPDKPSSYPVHEGYSAPNSDRKLNQYVTITQFSNPDLAGGGSASAAPMSKCFWEKSTSSKHLARTSARWWIESTNQPRDSWSIAVSKSCLGVSEATDFAFHAVALIDQEIVETTPTSFFSDYLSFRGDWREVFSLRSHKARADSKAIKNPQTCVELSQGSGFNQVTCADKREWEFELCMKNSKSTLQILKNNKWVDFKPSKGVKKIAECPSDYYFHKFSSAYYVKKFDKANKFSYFDKINQKEVLSKRRYRVYLYGKPPSYLDIKIESNDPYWDRND